jgi:molybdopterin converting factor small subunit
LFASAREAAGVGSVEIDGATVAEVLTEARTRFGQGFSDVLGSARIWLDGEPTDDAAPVEESSEIAVLPPVSGGC